MDCGYSLEPLGGEAPLTSTHNLCFEQNNEKISEFLSENFHFFFGGKIFSMFELACSCNVIM